jgi:hypothetical protein
MRACRDVTEELPEAGECSADYVPPLLITAGHVRDVTKGSSASGKADANSQYYW